ncbi:hypothetical protein C8J56DRAFT_1164089 [Mycena floridula]|nr:hypothetical protein C8J56DRAFT_1164089 [Mycena floridula]
MSNPSSCSVGDDVITLVQFSGVSLTIASTLGYGIYLPIAMLSMYILLRRGLSNSRARSVLFAFLVVILIVTTALFASNVQMAHLHILGFLAPERVKASDVTSFNQSYVLSVVSNHIIYFMSDLIVVWRAWAICNTRYIKVVLTVCIAGSLVGITIDAVRNVQAFFGTASYPTVVSLGIYLPVLLTNVVATSAIALQAWRSRDSLLKHLNRASSTSKAERILLILIESGVLYCVFWIIDVIFAFVPSLAVKEYGYLYQFVPYILALYPSVIVILVTREFAPCETAFQKPSFVNRPLNNSARLSSDIQLNQY